MPGELVVREASPSDIEPCLRIATLAAPDRHRSAWRTALASDLEQAERLLVVAEIGSELIGYGRARRFAPEPEAPANTAPPGHYLIGLYVQEGHRRRGVGARLTQVRLDWIRARAADAWFFANARNSASIELHRRLGFQEVTRDFSYPGVTFGGGEGILFRLPFA